jgi:Icc-related predicted phosphoesterase
METRELRIAAVGDIHCSKGSQGRLSPIFAQASKEADFLVLCGDLTDYGLPDEARILADELKSVGSVPVIAVLGNHDFESAQQEAVTDILTEAGVFVLDGDVQEMHGVAFAGTKGFAGGFGSYALQPWGESAIKDFVKASLDESMKLETALAKARSREKVVILHYSPIVKTVEGEPLEIYPFLGSSRLEEPIDRFGARVVFHGHAHRGSPAGHTKMGIPVYNVSLPLLRQQHPSAAPYFLYTIPVPTVESVSA